MRLIELFCLFVGNGLANPTNDRIDLASELTNVRQRLILCEFRESREKLSSTAYDRELSSNEELRKCQYTNFQMKQKISELEFEIAELQRR